MKIEAAKKLIVKELKDLDISENSQAYKLIYDNAIAASEILTKKELIELIEGSADSFPNHLFEI